MANEQIDIFVNDIRALYLLARSGGIPKKDDLLKNNITDLFWRALIKMIENEELLNIAIRGKTGVSKSTTGCKILYVGMKTLQRLERIPKMQEQEIQDYMYSKINSDQTEFLRFAMKQKGETISLIDEFSTMGETGFNATTETAMYKEHSDLFAQEKIHKISCSPTTIADRNADIILDVIGINKEEKVTRCMINYRDTTEWLIYPLGVVDIYVGDVMEMDFYKRYRVKKFQRLDLLKKHGVKNVKELEFSIITMNAYNEMKEIAIIKKQSQDIILGIIESERRKLKMQYSILTLNYVVMMVKGMLDICTEIQMLRNKKDKLGAKAGDDVKLAIINNSIDKYQKILLERIGEEEQKIKIEKSYRNIK